MKPWVRWAVILVFCLTGPPRPARAAETGDAQDNQARQEWMAGYVKLEEGGRAEEEGNAALALSLYRDALQTFEDVRRKYPDWNPSLLGYRITYCTQRIRRLESRVKQQSTDMSREDLARTVAEQVDRIRQLTDENQALRTRLATTAESLERARLEAARTVSAAEDIKDVMAERSRLREEAAALRQQVEQLTAEVGALRQKGGLEEAARQLREDLARTRARETQLEEAFDTYRRAYENVKEKLRLVTAEQEQWSRQNRELTQRAETAAAEAAEARRLQTEAEARATALEQRQTETAAALAARQTEAETLRRDLDQARAELAELRQTRDQAAQAAAERQQLADQTRLLAAARAAAEERAAALEQQLRTALERDASTRQTREDAGEAAALLRELAQGEEPVPPSAGLNDLAEAVRRNRADLQRRLAAAEAALEARAAELRDQAEKLAAAAAVELQLEDRSRALAAARAEAETLRRDLVRERTALAEAQEQALRSAATLQQAAARSAELEKQNADLTARLRELERTREEASRSGQAAGEQVRQLRDLLAAAEGERARLSQKSEEQLALLKQQEKNLRDLEQQRRDLAQRAEQLQQEVDRLKAQGAEQAAAFARDAAMMKAKAEVVDGLTASLADADRQVEELRRRLAALEQEKTSLETRCLEAAREVREREQEAARYQGALSQNASGRETALLQQIREISARLEAETAKRRALEASLASLPAPPAAAAVAAAPQPAPPPADAERDRREREQAALVRGYLRQAVAAEKDGKVEAARWNYERVLQHDGENKLATQRLGLLAAQQGDDETSVRYLKQAFRLDPDDLQTILPLGFALLRRQEADLAVSMLSRAVALEPANATAHRCLGLACSSLGWYDAAEVQFRRAHELNAKDSENAFNLAVLLATRQPPRLDEARQWYNRARELGAAPDPGLDRLFGVSQ